jgi:alkanesulfonate monooxygenase SsuD/methylene tetrahydromethanopterin reductase-like flavin-dependent oxidoreductase (luciferase family)
MDAAGVDAAVIFPLSLLAGIGLLGPEMCRATLHVYNDWVAEAVEPLAPDRMIAARLLPIDEPWAAAKELAAQLDDGGMRAVLLPALPNPGEPAWRVVLSELAGAGVTVCVPGRMESQADHAAELVTSYSSLRIVVAPIDIVDPAPSRMVAWLFDREALSGSPMYCADLPRRPLNIPSSIEEAATTALRAFRFADRQRPLTEAAIRLKERLPLPRDERQSVTDRAVPSIAIALSNVVDDGPWRADTVVASARLLEDAGFAGIWVGDTVARFAQSLTLDPFIMLALAGGATSRVELGTAILQVPLRRRVELAQRVLSLHELLPGRFTLGVGAGSTQVDFDAVGVPFTSRFHELGEAVPEMKALWRGEKVGNASLHSTPEGRGGPPVLLGSWGGHWVERAARDYDGWIASGTRTWRALADAIGRFRDAGGGRAVLGTVFADLSAETGPVGGDDRVHLACSPAEAMRRLHRLAEMGFTDVIVFNRGPRETLPDLAKLAATTTQSQSSASVQATG